MTDLSMRLVTLGIGVIALASFLVAVLFSMVNGTNILHGFLSYTAEYRAVAGTDALIGDKEIDSATLYKLLDTNRNSIADFNIIKKDGTYIRDIRALLDTPSVYYSIKNLEGETNDGLTLEMREIGVKR